MFFFVSSKILMLEKELTTKLKIKKLEHFFFLPIFYGSQFVVDTRGSGQKT